MKNSNTHTLNLITTNAGKFKIAEQIFNENDVKISQLSIETPEIQSLDTREVVKFSAEFACQKLNQPCLKSDVGYFIPALNNCPGALVKFANQSLSADNILSIMSEKTDRRIFLRECLALAIPGEKTVFFETEIEAQIAEKASEKDGSTFDKIVILPGFSSPKADFSTKENHDFFKQNLKIYKDVADFWKNRQK
jgi:non-canonical purine NTP pyrophosphatase (RdgB/HAM1 family)